MDSAFYILLALVIGFVIGASVMVSIWKESVKRCGFEIGGKLYRVTQIEPRS